MLVGLIIEVEDYNNNLFKKGRIKKKKCRPCPECGLEPGISRARSECRLQHANAAP